MRCFTGLRSFAALAILALSSQIAAKADILAIHNTGSSADSGGYYGQAFTVAGTGTYDNIRFSFLSPTGTPVAVQTGYIFTSPYTDVALDISYGNYLGSAAASGSAYTFSPDLQLSAGQTYYFYEYGGILGNILGIDSSGTGAYATFTNELAYGTRNYSMLYTVTGDPVSDVAPTPEPTSLALLGTGMLGFAALLRRRSS